MTHLLQGYEAAADREFVIWIRRFRDNLDDGMIATTPEALIETSRALLTTMIANAPLALAGCIEAVDRGLNVTLDEGCTIESDFFGLLSSTEDMKEGMRAFLEKRAPTFTGR